MRKACVLSIVGLVLLWSTGALAQQVLVAPFVEDDVPLDPREAAAVFAQATPLTIPLIPQIIVVPNGGGTVPYLHVQAVHNGRALFLQFTWADAKANRELFKYEEFSDAVAVQFSVSPDVVPTPFMGDAQHPVNIWQWKAAWEADQFGLRGVEQAYPNVHFDFYFLILTDFFGGSSGKVLTAAAGEAILGPWLGRVCHPHSPSALGAWPHVSYHTRAPLA